jgi:hypothetical protein
MDRGDLARVYLDLRLQQENAQLLLSTLDGGYRSSLDDFPPNAKAVLFSTRERMRVVIDAARKATLALQPVIEATFPEGVPVAEAAGSTESDDYPDAA